MLSLPRSWPANREMDFAARTTSTTHNQSLVFSLVLSPKRRHSQTTSIILLINLLHDLYFSPPPPPFCSSSALLLGMFHCSSLRGPLPDHFGKTFTLYKNNFKKIHQLLIPAYFLPFNVLDLPLTFLNVEKTTGFSFCIILFFLYLD